jgi:hypothetical protein
LSAATELPAHTPTAYTLEANYAHPLTKTIDLSEAQYPPRKKDLPFITIWVHGTNLLKPLAVPLFRMAKIYMFPPEGFYPVTHLPENHDIYAIAMALTKSAPDDFSRDHFYVLGWPEDLDFEQRKTAAEKLYSEIKKLVSAYHHEYGITPRIRVMAHSHGGNVVLNMARIKNPADGISIAEAILLACPVQEETREYIHDRFFEKIYAFYSTRDNIQVLDPQGMYITGKNQERHVQFSQRRFPHDDHLHQAQLKGRWFCLLHEDFIKPSFVKHLPTLIAALETWEQEVPAQRGQERIFTLLHC